MYFSPDLGIGCGQGGLPRDWYTTCLCSFLTGIYPAFVTFQTFFEPLTKEQGQSLVCLRNITSEVQLACTSVCQTPSSTSTRRPHRILLFPCKGTVSLVAGDCKGWAGSRGEGRVVLAFPAAPHPELATPGSSNGRHCRLGMCQCDDHCAPLGGRQENARGGGYARGGRVQVYVSGIVWGAFWVRYTQGDFWRVRRCTRQAVVAEIRM